MNISPKASMWLNVLYLILTAVATGTLKLTGLVSGETATQIVAAAGLVSSIINIVLHSVSSPSAGPLAG